MEETFSSLVCFQLPPSGPSLPFAVSKTQMSMSGLWGLCCPWPGGPQSWWVQAGKARKSTETRLRLWTEMHGCTYTQNAACACTYTAVCASLHAGMALFLHVREHSSVVSCSTCPRAGWGRSCVFTRACGAATGWLLHTGNLCPGSQGLQVYTQLRWMYVPPMLCTHPCGLPST